MSIVVNGLPPLTWSNGVGQAEQTGPGSVVVTAAAGSDWTNDALGGPHQHAATSLAFAPPESFSLSARVRVLSSRTTFDAAVLAVRGDRDHWAKLCFEFSPQGQGMIVSVVTNGYSDDCNSTVVRGDCVFLRVIRISTGWAFHASDDGVRWDLVRVFRLAYEGPITVGLMAQAPQGETCVAAFDRIEYSNEIPADLRGGS